ncbi:MAG: hypothetical protein M3443_00945 [Actinomycetota bacterium]|nr:hypothetical protein [Actinomycetota bacterium]
MLPLIIQQDAVAGSDTLLARNYLAGWAAACALVVIGAGLSAALGRCSPTGASVNPQPLGEIHSSQHSAPAAAGIVHAGR